MTEYVRPLSRIKAVELTEGEIDGVGGGVFNEPEPLQTQVLTNTSGNTWTFDGMKSD